MECRPRAYRDGGRLKTPEVILYPGQPHTFVFGQDGSPEATRKCFEDCDRFFKKYLPHPPSPLEPSLLKADGGVRGGDESQAEAGSVARTGAAPPGAEAG